MRLYVSMVFMMGFAIELTDKVFLLGIRASMHIYIYTKKYACSRQFIIQSLEVMGKTQRISTTAYFYYRRGRINTKACKFLIM
jgi:hypothetical protein